MRVYSKSACSEAESEGKKKKKMENEKMAPNWKLPLQVKDEFKTDVLCNPLVGY